MALAPPRNPPARPRTGSVRTSHGMKKGGQKRVAALRLLGAEHGSALQKTHRPERNHSPDEFIHAWRGSTGRSMAPLHRGFIDRRQTITRSDLVPTNGRHPPTAAGECRRRGGVRLRGREPHGCGDRAYRDVLAASPAISPVPAKPSTPLLLWTLLVLQKRVQGRRPCNTQNLTDPAGGCA